MRGAQQLLLSVVGLLLLSFQPALGFVGQVDTEDRFPFVVRIFIGYGDTTYSCTGSVSRAGLVSTAAHCVWNPDIQRYPDWVQIDYRDSDGVERTASALKLFVPPEYAPAAAKWKRDGSDTGSSIADFHRMTLHDIAFIVPDAYIDTGGLPHWASELLDENGELTQQTVTNQLANYQNRRMLIVGYGKYACADYDDREENCKDDGQRRFGEVALEPEVTVDGDRFASPDIWCTGRNAQNINPVQHGDSGGPVFVRTVDGRWVFVGYNSGGDADESCASSLFYNLQTWQQAASYFQQVVNNLPYQATTNWELDRMTYLLKEVLESLSAPNSEAVPRLDTLFAEGNKAEIADLRKQFAAYPERTYTLIPGTIELQTDDTGDPDASISGHVNWTKTDRAGKTSNGVSRVEISTYYSFDDEGKLAIGGQPVRLSSLSETVLDGDANTAPTTQLPGTLWDHNGSKVRLTADGSSRTFTYEEPRQGMLASGVQPGTVLFSGQRQGNRYAGTAYVFSSTCGPQGYQVEGPVSPNQLRVDLYGNAPRRGPDCTVTGQRSDHLVFTYKSQ